MQSSTDISKLATALVAVQGAIKPIARTEDNPFFRSSYADIAAVWEGIRSPLTDAGLSVVQTGETLPDGKPGLRTTLLHTSGQWISGVAAIVAKDMTDPQKVVAGITYLRRAMLSAIVGACQAAEDDDGNAAAKEKAAREPDAPPAKTQGKPPAHEPAKPSGKGGEVHCETMLIQKVGTKDGTGARGKWTRWYFNGEDGQYYNTFSRTVGEALEALSGGGAKITYAIKDGPKGPTREVLNAEPPDDRAPAADAPGKTETEDNIPF